MTDEEKAAMEWLDGAHTHWTPNPDNERRDTIKAMLSRPVLLEEPTPEILKAMRDEWWRDNGGSYDVVREIYRALYAHLTAPKTKEMWLVSWVDKWGKLHEHYFDTLDIALPNYRGAVNNFHYHDARLSGPHEREVSA